MEFRPGLRGKMFRRIIIGMLTAIFAAQVSGISDAKEKIEFELLKEWEFEKEIRDVRFAETENGGLYPKIIVFEDEVRFYNERSDLLAARSYAKHTEVTFSTDADYVGLRKVMKSPTLSDCGMITFTVYNDKGEKNWEKEQRIDWEKGSPVTYLSAKRSAVEASFCTGTIVFLNSRSEKIIEIDLFKNDEFDHEKIGVGAFSENGEWFGINVQERPAVSGGLISRDHPGMSGNPSLILYTAEGREKWRHKLPVFYSQGIVISSTGEYVIGTGTTSSAENRTWLVDRDGGIVRKYNFFSRDVVFSSNEEYTALDYWEPSPTILLIESKNGGIIWKYTVEDSLGRISNLCVSRKREVMVTFGKMGYFPKTKKRFSVTPQIHILDFSGERICRMEFPEKDLVLATFSKSGEKIGISTNKRVECRERR